MRVYERRGDLYACRYATGRPATLSARVGEEYWYPKPAIKLRGTVVAYALTGPTDPNEGDELATIERFDTRFDVSSPRAVKYRSVRAGPRVPKVGSLVLRRDGAAAWIACPRGQAGPRGSFKPTCDRPGNPDRVFTVSPEGTKRKLVGAGTQIDPQSLRLRGSRISWMQRRHRRSARL